ncbi:MAG: DUF2442 domain-containing protein [Bacteroidota bacterium]
MSTSISENAEARVESIHFEKDALVVKLIDRRVISTPLAWYPRLYHGSTKERENYRLIGKGFGIHWPDLEEDVSVSGLIIGRPSEESQESLAKWLAARKSG